MKVLYTARATADDAGRVGGSVRSDDGALDLQLVLPPRLGGPEGAAGTNPEQLFAAGYAGCFANALRGVARRMGREESVEGATVTAEVDLGALGGGRWGIGARLAVDVPGLAQEEAEQLVAAAHERCPYSNATRGNIDVALEVTGAPG